MRVARRWLRAGESVHAVTRSDNRAEEFRQLGITPIVADVTDAKHLPALPSVDTVLYAVGFDRTSGHDRRSVYVDGLANMLAALPAESDRIIYISSTSVYGQNNGETVDETSASEPATDGVALVWPPKRRCAGIRLARGPRFCVAPGCMVPGDCHNANGSAAVGRFRHGVTPTST